MERPAGKRLAKLGRQLERLQRSPASAPRDTHAHAQDQPSTVIRLRLRKQPSVDSGINLDAQAVKHIPRDIKQLSK